jgi:predicted DNA binding protein
MVQYDCPYIASSDDYEVEFLIFQWDNLAGGGLDTHALVKASDSEELTNVLLSLKSHDHIDKIKLLSRKNSVAMIRSILHETDAMKIIRKYGYVIGPFEAKKGIEIWRLGFDTEKRKKEALSLLKKNNDFTINDEQNSYLTSKGLDNLREIFVRKMNLTSIQKQALLAAIESGYFKYPRKISLSELSSNNSISVPGFSKNLRKAECKVFDSVKELIALTSKDAEDLVKPDRLRNRK